MYHVALPWAQGLLKWLVGGLPPAPVHYGFLGSSRTLFHLSNSLGEQFWRLAVSHLMMTCPAIFNLQSPARTGKVSSKTPYWLYQMHW